MVEAVTWTTAVGRGRVTREDMVVVGASSAGALFEFYDFFLYGGLATHISDHFFAGVNATTSYILALLTFAAGFAVRPFGAVVFGRGGVPGRWPVVCPQLRDRGPRPMTSPSLFFSGTGDRDVPHVAR